MTKNESRVTRKGQVTIPIEMRRDLGIEEGDKVLFVQCDGGFLHVTRSSDNSSPDISKLEHNSMNLKPGALAKYAKPTFANDQDRIRAEKDAMIMGWTERERRYLIRQNQKRSTGRE